MKKYQIIYADPPWEYKQQLQWDKKCIYKLEHFYPTMPTDKIKELDIPSEKDSWLIIWTTVPRLQEGLDVLKSWGGEYRTSGVWDKGNGLGYFFRVYHEILLIGKKGNPKNPTHSVPSVFREARRRHSQKPDCVRKWIEECFSDMTKIELFARQKTPGWDVWGNEVASDIDLTPPRR